jgi:hypothetical protein
MKTILNFSAVCKIVLLKVQRDVEKKLNERDVSVADAKEMKLYSTKFYYRHSMLKNWGRGAN